MKILKVNIFCTKGIKIKLGGTVDHYVLFYHNNDIAGQNEDDMEKSSQLKYYKTWELVWSSQK